MTYDLVLQMSTDPYTHRLVFARIATPPSSGATVLGQKPAPDTIIPYGAKVALELTWLPRQEKRPNPNILTHWMGQVVPPQPSVVPKLMDVNQTEASRRLEIANLRGSFVGGPDGVVIAVDPPELRTVPRKSQISVTMGTHVPHLTGQTLDRVSQILANFGLILGKISTPNGPGGTISSSDPPTDTGVLLNSSVNVSLSGYPLAQPPPVGVTENGVPKDAEVPTQNNTPATPTSGQLIVPDVTQKGRKSAYITLEQAGFLSLDSHGNVKGVVSSQSPSGNTVADPMLPVDLYFELPQTTTPDVMDLAELAAVSRIKEGGLRTTISRRASWVPGSLETVLNQDPLPGTMVDPNSAVRIVVGVFAIPTNLSLVGLVVLAIVVLVGGALAGLRTFRLLLIPLPMPAVVPTRTGPVLNQSNTRHHSAVEARCTFVPHIGLRHFYIHAGGPKTYLSFTLRSQERTSKYKIASQPSITKVD
jgi:beta-lactam-binding protein with PASTA domain